MGRDRTRGPARRLRRLLVVVVLVTAAAGAGVASTSSFTLVDLDRPGTVDVVADSSGALALDTAGSVRAGTRQRLVTVGNDLGYDGVTVTVSLADGSDGTLYAGTEQGDSVTVTLDRGATSDVEVEASAGADSLQFDVTASAAGLSVSAPNRVVSVVGGVEVDVEFKGCSAVWLVITDGSPPFDATIRVDNGTTTDHDVTVNDGDTELVPGQHGDDPVYKFAIDGEENENPDDDTVDDGKIVAAAVAGGALEHNPNQCATNSGGSDGNDGDDSDGGDTDGDEDGDDDGDSDSGDEDGGGNTDGDEDGDDDGDSDSSDEDGGGDSDGDDRDSDAGNSGSGGEDAG